MIDTNDDLLTVKEIAMMLGLGKSTLFKKLQHSLIKKVFLGRKMFIPRAEIPNIKTHIDYNDEFVKDSYLPTNKVAEFIANEISNVKRNDINNWIRDGKVNSILHMGFHYIHKKDLSVLINLLKNERTIPLGYCSIEEAATFLEMHPGTIQEWASNKDIQSILVIVDRYWRTYVKRDELIRVKNDKTKKVLSSINGKDIMAIPEDISSYENLKKEKELLEKNNKYLNLREAAEKMGVTAKTIKVYLHNKEYFRNTKKVLGDIFILLDDLEEYRVKSIPPTGYLSYKELLGKYNLKVSEISNLKRLGFLNDILRVKRKLYFNEKEILSILESLGESILKQDELSIDYISPKEMAGILGIPYKKVLDLCKEGVLQSVRVNQKNYIKKDEVRNYREYLESKKKQVPEDYISPKEMAETLGISYSRVIYLCKKEVLQSVRLNHKIYIYKSDQNNHKEYLERKKQQKVMKVKKEEEAPIGYVSTKEMAKILGISLQQVGQLCKKGVLKRISKKNRIYIHLDEINSYEKYLQNKNQQQYSGLTKAKKDAPVGYIYIKEACEKINLSYVTIQKYIKNNKIKPIKIGRYWFLHAEELQELVRLRSLENKKSIKKPELIHDIKKNFIILKCKDNIKNNIFSYQEFSILKVNATNGRINNVRRIYSQLKKLFLDIIVDLKVDVLELTEESIEEFLSDPRYSTPTKEHFISFIRYVYSAWGKQMNKEFVISRKIKLINKDINNERYTPEVYEAFNNHVKNIEEHIKNSIKSREYSNMWVLTTMLLTTAWRPSDIIFEMPRIDITVINNIDFKWFLKNRLSIGQCNLIIQQLHLLLGNSLTSKTSKPLRLLVSPDMIEPLAHSVVISELHARGVNNNDKKSELLGSFISQNTLQPFTSGITRHKKFFKNNLSIKDFQSSKLHNSTMTYLFLDISEAQEFSELSIETIGWMRSHKDINTTATYIKLVNKDGSLDRVSINLFKRGHFGWLYNYMIKLVFGNLNYYQAMEQRTDTIVSLRNEFTPTELEHWAKSLLKYEKEKNNTIRKLIKMEGEKLKELLFKVFKCLLPSRDGCGQCIDFPLCAYPDRKVCIGCENFIPQFYQVFIEAKNEFIRLVKSIENSHSETIITRDSSFLLNILLLFNEAADSFGIDIVNGYLSLEERKNNIQRISAKLKY